MTINSLIDHIGGGGGRRLRTAATNGPNVHPPNEWRSVVVMVLVVVVVVVMLMMLAGWLAGWGKLLTRPSRDIWERAGGMDEEMRIPRISIFNTSTDL
jgi:hypothetical protein